jgi:hypothetical protein
LSVVHILLINYANLLQLFLLDQTEGNKLCVQKNEENQILSSLQPEALGSPYTQRVEKGPRRALCSKQQQKKVGVYEMYANLN